MFLLTLLILSRQGMAAAQVLQVRRNRLQDGPESGWWYTDTACDFIYLSLCTYHILKLSLAGNTSPVITYYLLLKVFSKALGLHFCVWRLHTKLLVVLARLSQCKLGSAALTKPNIGIKRLNFSVIHIPHKCHVACDKWYKIFPKQRNLFNFPLMSAS